MRGLLRYLVLSCILSGSQTALAQVMVSPTGKPPSLEICGPGGLFSLLVANTTGGTMTGATLTLDLPPSVLYIPGTITGGTELNISNLNQPVFTLSDILNNTAHPVTFNARLACGYTNTGSYVYIITYGGVPYTGTDPPLQNFYFAQPTITSITNNAAVIPVNSTVTRNITVVQQGMNASLDTLWVLDQHTTDIHVVNVSLGTMHYDYGPGPVQVDTIVLTGNDLPGGNGRFDPGETVVIGETVRLTGCTNGQSTIKAAWGCDGQLCSFYSAFPSVSPVPGDPDINLAFTSNRRSWGFIDNSGYVEFTVTNTGTGLGGTAFNLTILAGFSSGGSTYYPNGNYINKIDSFSVNGNYLPSLYSYSTSALSGLYAFYTPCEFTFDPDGAGTGIQDADGDGFFDDLPAGGSFTIRAHTYYSWSQALSTIATGKNCGSGWTNSAWQGFRFGYHLENQCRTKSGVNWIPNSSLNQFMTYNTATVQTAMPPDLYDLVPGWYEQTVSTSTAVNAEGCPNDSVLYKVILPPGLTVTTGFPATFKGVSMGFPALSGDTAIFFLDRSRILSGGLFRVPIVAKCAFSPPSTATIKSRLQFWCDKTNYRDRYFTYWCGTSPLFGIQCPVTNCADPSISRFTIQRTTLGWTDARCTTKVASSAAGLRLDHAMARDTIRLAAGGRIRGPVDSLYFQLRHNTITSSWGNRLFFDYVADTLKFFDVETGTWHVCAGLSPAIVNGTTSTYTVYFGGLTAPGGCLAGLTFTAGDSLYYIACGKVKNVSQQDWQTVQGLRARFFWREQGAEHACNDLGTFFMVLGSNYSFSTSTNYQQIVLEGCTSFQFEGLILRTLDACGGDNGFPNEVRPYCVIDTMRFTLPEGFTYQAGSSTHGYYLDNGSYMNESIGDPSVTTGSGGTVLTFVRGPTWGYPDYYDCWYDHDRIRFYASPSCKATGNYTYKAYGRGRYQVYANGTGVSMASTANISVTYTPPLVTLNRLVGTAEGRQDTVTWKISLCNARTFGSNNQWISFESPTGGINIVSVKDITAPASPVTFSPVPFGTGKKWVEAGSLAASQYRYFEIRATYTSCSYDSVRIRHGYNCATYPVSPDLGYPPSGYGCGENNTWLYLDPKSISLNVSLTSPVNPVDLCDTLEYIAAVTNSQLATGYDPALTLSLPPGVMIVPGSSEIRYPYNTGLWAVLTDPVNLPPGSDKWVYDLAADTNGLTRLPGVDSVPANGYQLRFHLLTGCDFTSGKSVKVTASAATACGEVQSRSSYTQPVVISGLPTNISLYAINTVMGPDLPTCGDSAALWIKVINLGPGSASSIEKIGINLDDAFDYSTGSLTGIHNGPTGIASNAVNGGIRYINFAIQPNLPVNDSIVFSFRINDTDPGGLTCDTIPVETTTLMVGDVPCASAPGGSCEIQSITTSTVQYLNVVKDRLSMTFRGAASVASGAANETVTVSYFVKNTGTLSFHSDTLGVDFFYDANGNGLPDEPMAEQLFSQPLWAADLAPGDSVAGMATFTVPGEKICGLMAVIRLSDNPCICGDAWMQVEPVILRNAGPDPAVCSNDSVQFGMAAQAGYVYAWIPTQYLSSPALSSPLFCYPGPVPGPTPMTYILQTIRPGGCVSHDTVTVTVLPSALADAGPDALVCQHDTILLSGAGASYYLSVQWETLGDGTFMDTTVLFASYVPGPADIAYGAVTLKLTAHGACGSFSDLVTLTFKPLPQVTNQVRSTAICPDTSALLILTGSPDSTAFAWTASGSSAAVTGFEDGSGDTINQLLHNSGLLDEIVTYIITPSLNGCSGDTARFRVVVHPIPDVLTNPGFQTVCTGQPATIQLTSTVPSATFNWTASGPPALSGYSNGAGVQIRDTIINSSLLNETVTYVVVPSAFGCPPGMPGPAGVTVLPGPQADAGPDTLVCPRDTILLTGSVAYLALSVTWETLGDGTFIDSTLLHASYIPGPDDVAGGSVLLKLTALGDCGFHSDLVKLTFKPLPQVTNPVRSMAICTAVSPLILLTGSPDSTTFDWTASGSSVNISGFEDGSGDTINQLLVNAGLQEEWASYVVTPAAGGCVGDTARFLVYVHPVPDVTPVPVQQTVCSGQPAGISMSSSVPEATFTWTASGLPVLSGFSAGSGGEITDTLINSSTVAATVTYLIAPSAYGCPPGPPQQARATVKPVPHIIHTDTMFSQCSESYTSIALQANPAGSTCAWQAWGSAPGISGYQSGNGTYIHQWLKNTGTADGDAVYEVAATYDQCTGPVTTFTVTVHPVSDAWFEPAEDTLCSGDTCRLALVSHVTGTSFSWTASATSGLVTGYGPGSGSQVNQAIRNSGTPARVNYVASSSYAGCPGTGAQAQVTVNPVPEVNIPVCFDRVTTLGGSAIMLRGATPPTGTWTGTGVTGAAFSPVLAGYGNHVITYTYRNQYQCPGHDTVLIRVTGETFTCGEDLTDVRNGRKYRTSLIGGQCWMRENLNHGSRIGMTDHQTDNCTVEKYCLPSDPSCAAYGGLYQWDELMGYCAAESDQGLCPPGWHVPSAAEWQTLIDTIVSWNIHPADGIAGSFLKEPNYFPGFHALLKGVLTNNSYWSYLSGREASTLFWTSTPSGALHSQARGMNVFNYSVSSYRAAKSQGYPVRCIRNLP